jgi:hypothetical protein
MLKDTECHSVDSAMESTFCAALVRNCRIL